jgi:hypothetical protein
MMIQLYYKTYSSGYTINYLCYSLCLSALVALFSFATKTPGHKGTQRSFKLNLIFPKNEDKS